MMINYAQQNDTYVIIEAALYEHITRPNKKFKSISFYVCSMRILEIRNGHWIRSTLFSLVPFDNNRIDFRFEFLFCFYNIHQ